MVAQFGNTDLDTLAIKLIELLGVRVQNKHVEQQFYAGANCRGKPGGFLFWLFCLYYRLAFTYGMKRTNLRD